MPENKIDYLRISVTDRCNLRCAYCMPPEGIDTFPANEILGLEEILRLVRIFSVIGVKRVRLTGGEPLVRKDIADLIGAISAVCGIEEIVLTTNGVLLAEHAQKLKEAGVRGLNISLDTLKEDKFRAITGKDLFRNVMRGIDEASEMGFKRLKLNAVILNGINDDEIADFVRFAILKNMILRFIEFMDITPMWREDRFIGSEDIKNICRKDFTLERMENRGPGPAEYYKVNGHPLLGFIKTDEGNCARCSRLRVTSVGELKICLYEKNGLSLKWLLRNGATDAEISAAVRNRIGMKYTVAHSSWQAPKLYMSSVGG